MTVTAGQEVDITASATDEDGDTVSYAWSRKAGETTPALPQGTALDQARLTFTPAAAGVYTMTVTADDGYGNTASEEVTVTVGASLAPGKPTGFTASPGNQQVILSWGRSRQRQHQQVASPAKDRQQQLRALGGHQRLRRRHHQPHGDEVDQRHGIRLPDPCSERCR